MCLMTGCRHSKVVHHAGSLGQGVQVGLTYISFINQQSCKPHDRVETPESSRACCASLQVWMKWVHLQLQSVKAADKRATTYNVLASYSWGRAPANAGHPH